MNAVLRDIEARLRRACAEQAFVAAAAASREWSSAMAAPVAVLSETAATPTVPDVRGLLDPLADSALARAGRDPVPAKGDGLEPPESSGRASFPGARPSIESRSAAASGDLLTSAKPRKGATCDPSQIESLLARHARLGAGSRDSATERIHGEPATTRNIVQLPRRQRAGEPATRAERASSSRAIASTIARWDGLMVRSARDRPGVDVVADRPAPLSPDAPYAAGAPFDAAMFASRELAEGEATRPDVMLRLVDLTDPLGSQRPESNASHRPDPAAPPVAMPGMGSVDDPSSAGAEWKSLGRVFDSLARIEQQVAARVPHAPPVTQWYDDDDGLAGRIHEVLRRQVERHGIDLP